MEGHAEMDMSVPTEGSLWHRIMSERGLTSISHYFVMDWASVWMDIVGGLLVAGAIAAWVPPEFWRAFFLTDHPVLATLWGPIVGPLVAIISFVCSVGNIPLAAALWNGGISFGGALAFILADLIVLPVLNIYRKYYGLKMAIFLLLTFYAAMAISALMVEVLFGFAGLMPRERYAQVVEPSITWNYTTWLNIAFLALAVVLVWRFSRTGGMGRSDDAPGYWRPISGNGPTLHGIRRSRKLSGDKLSHSLSCKSRFSGARAARSPWQSRPRPHPRR